MPNRICRFFIILASAAVLASCEGTFGAKEDDAAAPGVGTTESGTGDAGSTATTTGVDSSGAFQGHPLDDPSSPLSNRTVYFEFDSSEILPQDREILQAHARYLAANSSASVTLEGHADERGTREYNIALGERRANAVRQLMTLTGASGQQIRTVSYGEERPVAEGHDEESWRLNRRVEIIYRTR